jgi:hypothetical protein
MRRLRQAVIWCAVTTLLLAQDAPAAASSADAPELTDSMTVVGGTIGAVGLAVLGIAAYVVRNMLRRRRRYSHKALFDGLCSTHGLDRTARALLWQIARLHNLTQPARLFTEPQWLDPAGLQPSLGTRTAEAAALQSRLFAGSEDGHAPGRQPGPTA